MTLPRWPYLVFDLLNATWLLCGGACLGLGLFFVLCEDAIPRANQFLERCGKRHPRGILAAGMYLPFVLAFGNLARFRIYYLTSMSGVSANLAWNVAHGYGLRTAVYGDQSYFASHFAFAVCLFSPLLWIWNSAGALAFAQGFLLGTVPLFLFGLAKRLSRSDLLAGIMLLLCLAHPSFQELTGTYVEDSVFAVPFFIAAAYFFETERPALGALFGILMFSAREQVPFISFGVGLYLYFQRARPKKRAGAALIAASPLIWFLEMTVISRAQRHLNCPWVGNASLWDYFKALGGSPRGLLMHAVTRPWDFVIALAVPSTKLLPVLRILSHVAFIPVLSGAAFLPAIIAWIPNQLARPSTAYQGLRSYYSSFVLGPLLWATLHGLIQIREHSDTNRWRRTAAVLFAVAGWGFFAAPSFYSSDVRVIPKAWEESVPKALALIPTNASVWCDPYLLPHLAMRHYIKVLPGSRDCAFERNLFLPDYVVMSTYWARLSYPYSEILLHLLRRKNFRLLFREGDLIVLANPVRPAPGRREPEFISLPPAGVTDHSPAPKASE